MKAKTVLCTITKIFPDTEFNLLGHDNITFTGTNFPHDLTTSTIEIKFDDTASTVCTAQSSTTTTLVCLTMPFDRKSLSAKYKMVVKINGQTVVNTKESKLKGTIRSGSGLNPTSVSPVLKTKVKIQLEKDFPHVLKPEDFTVNATSTIKATYERYLNVVEVDDKLKTLTCMFGGAESGKFQMSIRHVTYGLVDTKGMILDVSS